MELEKFIAIVTTHNSKSLGKELDLESIYDFYGLPKTTDLSITIPRSYIYDCIRRNLSSNLNEIKAVCDGLIKNLFFKLPENNTSIEIFCRIIEEIYSAIKEASSVPFGEVCNWEKVFTLAADVAYINHSYLDRKNDGFAKRYNREFEIAKAAKRVEEKGFSVKINPAGEFTLDEPFLVNHISTLLSQLGGINVIRQILQEISPCYDKKQMRFHLVREMNTFYGFSTPTMPWGYLMQIAVRYPDCIKKTLSWNKNWNKLKAITRDYIALYDVQSYSLFELISHNATSLIGYLIELTLYDKFFCIPQLRPSYVNKLINSCLSWVDARKKIYKGFNLNDINKVAKVIVYLGTSQKEPMIFTVKDIAKYCKDLSIQNITIILSEIFSHPYKKANEGYLLARDNPRKNTNFYLRPLLALKNNEYFLANISICSYGIIEAIFDIARSYDNNSDAKIGKQIELLLTNSLLEKGVGSISGEYYIKKQKYDCDCIIETEKVIFILEIKKKSLGNLARSGNDKAIVIDLAKSLVLSQLQALRHEIVLRKSGSLELNNNGTIEKIQLNGRLIERVTVTLFDYGSLQHKVFIQPFLKSCIQDNFSLQNTEDEKIKKDFNDFIATLEELRLAWNELAVLNEDELNNPFVRSSFVSMPLLFTLLENVNSKNDFFEQYSKLSYMVLDSFDQYHTFNIF